jgi:hypothetical protein
LFSPRQRQRLDECGFVERDVANGVDPPPIDDDLLA